VFQVGIGALQLSLGDVDVVASAAAYASRRCVESTLCGGVVPACPVRAADRRGEGVSIDRGCGVDLT
jgi:hypothetical protein